MNIIKKTYKWNGELSNRKSTNRIILHHAESNHVLQMTFIDGIQQMDGAELDIISLLEKMDLFIERDLKKSLEVMPKDLTVILLEFALKEAI